MVAEKHALEISHHQLSVLIEQAAGLVKTYWETLEDRSAYPVTSGKLTTDLFARPWPDEGLGCDVLESFKTIADHSRPSNGWR